MEMIYAILYHPLVVSDDIPQITQPWRDIVRRTIEERLTRAPDLYGKPLRRSLKGYRKLRVGDWRIIFRIERTTVKILIIQHRSVVYDTVERRV